MPGPAPPQFPGFPSQLQPGGLGTKISGGLPWLCPLAWSPCPFCDQNRAWNTSAWAGDSMRQRGQHGTEACAPGDPGSGRATVLTRSAWPCSLWGRKEAERAGRSTEWRAELWTRRRSPWFLVSAAGLLCSLLSVPALHWLAVLICELWSFMRALQIKSRMVYDSRWIGWDKPENLPRCQGA